MNHFYKIPPVRSILFDFGGTLDSDGIAWKERFFPIYRSQGVPWSFPEFERYFYVSDDAIAEKKLKRVGYFKTVQMQVDLVLKAGGSYRKSLAHAIAEKFYKDSLKTIRRNIPLLRRLNRNYRLGIVSNFYGNMPVICQEAGLRPFLDVVADSALVGQIKPDPKIFRFALEKVGCDPEQTLFVGDSVSRDMQGAKSMGMPHVWLQAPDSKWKPCCEKEGRIQMLTELEMILSKNSLGSHSEAKPKPLSLQLHKEAAFPRRKLGQNLLPLKSSRFFVPASRGLRMT
ncbi:MAG: HAD family hydrolase [Elusimicrobia bacterium]|nr:HAD family hydrolase [Elusimicrobiota bacterium]